MPDRIVRDEVLRSERWLDLPTDTHRLVYISLLLLCDDYGNLEGGPRRLYRWMHGFTQVKTEPDSIKVMSDLQDSDMALRYEIDQKEFWHITRFKNSRWYWKRIYPQSPYGDDITNEKKQRPSEKRNTHVVHTSTTRREGVGVGVGVGEVQKHYPRPKNPDSALDLRRTVWKAYSNAYQDRYGVPPSENVESRSAIKRFCSKIPASDCALVAAYYLTHASAFYVAKGHDPKLLAADAAKLRTEWATGRQITQTGAMQVDKRASLHNAFKPLIEEAQQRESHEKSKF